MSNTTSTVSFSPSQLALHLIKQRGLALTEAGPRVVMTLVDGSGNPRRQKARAIRRKFQHQATKAAARKARELRARQAKANSSVAGASEPAVKPVARKEAGWMQWALDLVNGEVRHEGPALPPVDLSTADFIKALSADFEIKDYGDGAPLAGRPVMFFERDHYNTKANQKIARGLALLKLGPGDMAIFEATDTTKEESPKACRSVPPDRCTLFQEPAETAAAVRAEEAYIVAYGVNLLWARSFVPQAKITVETDTWKGKMNLYSQLMMRLVEQRPDLGTESIERAEAMKLLWQQRNQALDKADAKRRAAYLEQITKALPRYRQVAVAMGAHYSRVMLEDLKPLKPLFLTLK